MENLKTLKNTMESDPKDPMGRRNLLKLLGLGSTAGALGLFGIGSAEAKNSRDYETPKYAKGMAPVTVTNVKAIACAPGNANLIVVKIETSEPGLYGLGCATFTQRASVVVTAITDYLAPFCKGKDVDNIEDMWNSFYVDSYWRNGPVLNNVLSGMDQALWDIKGKRAGMPVYQLLGGKSRFAIPVYARTGGSIEQIAENVNRFKEEGYRNVRIGANITRPDSFVPDYKAGGYGYPGDSFFHPQEYIRNTIQMFDTVRQRCGEEIDLVHDIHEKIQPMEAIQLINALEEYRPFFIEDPLSPENQGWWKQLRESTNVPISMGELFNNINEFLDPMINRYFDYIRCHISQIGGISPAMKLSRLGEFLGIRTAWHGPGDVSPVGHAAHAHIDMAIWNFGVQEGRIFPEVEQEVFPGCPTTTNGYMHLNDKPGIGVDVNETLAAKYPLKLRGYQQLRNPDGTIIRP